MQNTQQDIEITHESKTIISESKAEYKTKRLRINPNPHKEILRKPEWIRIKHTGNKKINELKETMRKANLHSVCEEASCPNLNECFTHGTATFMIMGDICTRRCPFCDVTHGKPKPLDTNEPTSLAKVIQDMHLKYIVITSVDRDDLRDGGAKHFVRCVTETKKLSPHIQIEVLTPDFRGRMDIAIALFENAPLDVFNHNLETVPSLYKKARPGADYQHSLTLLKRFKDMHPHIKTKSGLMLGLGENETELITVLKDMREHNIDMLTLGQYLQPSKHHLKVEKFVHPDDFERYKHIALGMGFSQVASGPMVRSSYHADLQNIGKI